MRSGSSIGSLVVTVEAQFLGEGETNLAPALELDFGGATENLVDVDTSVGEVVEDALKLKVELRDGLCSLLIIKGHVNLILSTNSRKLKK